MVQVHLIQFRPLFRMVVHLPINGNTHLHQEVLIQSVNGTPSGATYTNGTSASNFQVDANRHWYILL